MKMKIKKTRSVRKEALRLDPVKLESFLVGKYENNEVLGEALGKTRATISLWRRGSGIPLAEAERVAALIGVGVGDILSDDTKAMLWSVIQERDTVILSLPRELVLDGILLNDNPDEKELRKIFDELKTQIRLFLSRLET